MLKASSTTQMIAGSRRGSPQIAHGSTSVMLLQVEQRKIFDLTSRIAAASASASPAVRLRMWYAMREADFAPTPGSLVSSLIRVANGGAVMVVTLSGCQVVDNRTTRQPDNLRIIRESSFLPSSHRSAPAFLRRLCATPR